jgi:hypothetical protein
MFTAPGSIEMNRFHGLPARDARLRRAALWKAMPRHGEHVARTTSAHAATLSRFRALCRQPVRNGPSPPRNLSLALFTKSEVLEQFHLVCSV